MSTHLVTFSDESMSRSAGLCVESAKRNGVELAIATRWEAIRNSWDLHGINSELLLAKRGPAYWSWKPFVIFETIGLLTDGSILIYSDAGVEFLAPVSHVIDRMDQDIFLFGNNWEHAHWCKRDVVEAVWPMSAFDRWSGGYDKTEFHNHTWQRFGKQVQASVIFFRVSDYTRKFVKEWLDWCLFQGGRLIDDSPSRLPNHPEFQEHRHDQAILTTMAYREGIKLHAWPAVYNRFLGQEFMYSREGYSETDNYPPLFHHHRLRNPEFDALGIKV